MHTWANWFANFLVSMLPFVLLIGFWLYFMKHFSGARHGQLVGRTFEHMDRVEALLERIAKAVEGTKTP